MVWTVRHGFWLKISQKRPTPLPLGFQHRRYCGESSPGVPLGPLGSEHVGQYVEFCRIGFCFHQEWSVCQVSRIAVWFPVCSDRWIRLPQLSFFLFLARANYSCFSFNLLSRLTIRVHFNLNACPRFQWAAFSRGWVQNFTRL